MGRDLSYRIISRKDYEDALKLKDADLWHDVAVEVGHGGDYIARNSNFDDDGTFTIDELKEKAHSAIDDNDFDTLEACVKMLKNMDEDTICVYHNL